MELKKFEKLKESYLDEGGEIKEFEKQTGKLDIGYKINYSKRITEADVFAFGLISGDWNPIHFDDDFASKTKFGRRIAQGMLTTSLVSAAVARMPGIILLLETKFQYLNPVYVGDLVKVEGKVLEKVKNRYCVEINCFVGDKIVASGQVKLLVW